MMEASGVVVVPRFAMSRMFVQWLCFSLGEPEPGCQRPVGVVMILRFTLSRMVVQ